MGVDTFKDEEAVKPILMPPEALPAFGNAEICEMVQKKFDISKSDIIKTKIHYCLEGDYQRRIVIPSYDSFGNLNFFITRTFDDWSMYKYKNCDRKPKEIIFNELFVNWEKPLILTESVKTHIKMIDYENFIPLLGSSFYKKSHLLNEMILNGTSEVILMLDIEAQNDTFEAAKKLLSYGFTVKIVENLKGENQPDKLDCDSILDCKNNAVKVDRMKLLKMKIQKGYNAQKNTDSYL